MTAHMIPDRLAVPLTWASTFTTDGSLTARDQSYSLTAGWLAAQRDPSLDGTDVMLGDNGLRLALQRSRRGKRDEEEGRVFRTVEAKATVSGIDEPVALPSLQVHYTSSGGVRVHRGGIVDNGDRQQQWTVPANLAAAMRVGAGDKAVEIPYSIMQHARNKMTLTLMLRVLALVAGDYDANWIVERHGQRLVLAMPYAEIMSRLGLPAKSEPKETLRRYLGPAAEEINEHTDYRVSITEKRTRYRSGPHSGKEGPLMGMVIDIEYPVIETPVSYPEPRQRGTPWKPKPKFHKPAKPQEAPPAIIDNIVALPDDDEWPDDDFSEGTIVNKRLPAPATPSRFGRRSPNT